MKKFEKLKNEINQLEQNKNIAKTIYNFPEIKRSNTGNRILIITPDIAGPIRNGGIGTAFSTLAIRLASRGFCVDILYTLGKHCEGNETIDFWISQYRQSGVNLIPLPDKIMPHLVIEAPYPQIQSWRVFQWVRKHAKDYDLCIAPEYIGELYYLMVARDTGIFMPKWPIVIVTHSPNQWASERNYRLPQSVDELYRDFMERQVVAKADVLVSPSSYMLEWESSRNWILPKETRVIPNLMLESIENILDTLKENNVQINELVFFGRLETGKGLEIFLRALSQMPPNLKRKIDQVTFLGKRTNDFIDLESRIRKSLDSTEDVPYKDISYKIIDNFGYQEAIEYLKVNGRLAVIPSLMENSPYTVLECLHYHIPFIASKVGGIPELISEEDHDKVLFKPNPGALARTLASILEKGACTVKPAYKAEEVENQWIELINSTINRACRLPKAVIKEEPLVSVCLTHKDRPLLLAQAIESLRKQDYKNFEVILVDDGSQDPESIRYLDILEKEFYEKKWQIVRQDNAYLGAARNHAARLTKGEWLMFMDDDDVAKPYEISTFVQAANLSGADILTCFNTFFYSNKPPKKETKLWLPLGADIAGGLYANIYGDANALVRKSVYDELRGYTEDYGVGHEDWEFFQNAVLKGYRLEVVPEPLYWYRIQEKSMTRSTDINKNYFRTIRAAMHNNPLGMALGYALYTHTHVNFLKNGNNELLTSILLSKSWRYTKPIRELMGKLRLIKQKIVSRK